MADRYRTPDGWTVEVVALTEGERLRIRHHGFYVADVRSVAELERWVPADELGHLERDTLILTARRVPFLDLLLHPAFVERRRRLAIGAGLALKPGDASATLERVGSGHLAPGPGEDLRGLEHGFLARDHAALSRIRSHDVPPACWPAPRRRGGRPK
jgi:hypothetical protein